MKAIFKVIAVSVVVWLVLADDVPAVIGLGRSDLAGALSLTFEMARQMAIAVLVLLATGWLVYRYLTLNG